MHTLIVLPGRLPPARQPQNFLATPIRTFDKFIDTRPSHLRNVDSGGWILP